MISKSEMKRFREYLIEEQQQQELDKAVNW